MKPESQRAAATRLTSELGFEVTRQMVREWSGKGWPLDRETLLAKIPNQERMPNGFKRPAAESERAGSDQPLDAVAVENELADLKAKLIAATDYEQARLFATQIKGLQLVLKELRLQGVYILKSEAQSAGMKAGNASKQKWEKLEDELPPILEGKEAAQMKVIIRKFARERCRELSQLFEV